MEKHARKPLVKEVMIEFAEQTGLSPAGKTPPRRYLWTDAFAVCNFLGLYRQTWDERHKEYALALVDQVHKILGRHRDDDPRTGWISGLDEQEGPKHPTKGGLRIGKQMKERGPADPFDERLEWDRDGQYYHYLTKWMHALNCVTRVTGDSTYNNWAMELAQTAHSRFTYAPPSGGQKRMCWKMSIDLSYPLVASMGQHDPLDGFITYRQLQATADRYTEESARPNLNVEIADMAGICEGRSWVTEDPLGIGGLLGDAFKVAQLMVHKDSEQTDLLKTLLDSSLMGLESYAVQNQLKLPAAYRLAFRELGLSIGLKAVKKLKKWIEQHPDLFPKKDVLESKIDSLMHYRALGERIEAFWLVPINREAGTWTAHRDINGVMLATSLAPDGFLAV